MDDAQLFAHFCSGDRATGVATAGAVDAQTGARHDADVLELGLEPDGGRVVDPTYATADRAAGGSRFSLSRRRPPFSLQNRERKGWGTRTLRPIRNCSGTRL